MKKIVFKADSRGVADHGWLKSYHSFSFANYYDPERVHFGLLRVLNDDTVAGGKGFSPHPHDNMEIISIPLKGTLAHKDSTGTQENISTSEVQIMSAGSGIIHSEFNASDKESVSFLQIWIFPKEKDIKPRYDQKVFSDEKLSNNLHLIVSPDKSEDTLWINQNAKLYLGKFSETKEITYSKRHKTGVFIFLIEGNATVGDENLNKRDAIGIWDTEFINIVAEKDSFLLLIEVPMF